MVGVYLIALAARSGQWAMGNGQWADSLAPTTYHLSPTTYHLLPVVLALLACLCGNVYIVGLNQLEDVEIDRINKPHLPLASGEFSRRQAIAIVALAGLLSLLIAIAEGPFLLATIGLSLMIGTAYSLPPFD